MGNRGQGDVRHFSDRERHTLAKEERKICKIGDGDVPASSTGGAYASIEVENELGRFVGQYAVP